jgi:thiol-disulfide isomerase/thioredoxin
MSFGRTFVGVLVIVAMMLAGCGAQSPLVIGQNDGAPTDPAATLETTPPPAEGQGPDSSSGEGGASPAAEGAVPRATWFSAELYDVNTGQTASVIKLQGKVILVETMAIWCPLCLSQQEEVKSLRPLLDQRDDLVFLTLDVDPNENADHLRAYAMRHGFDWIYAIAPAEVAREIGQLYGAQFLNPPSTPMLIIDAEGSAHALPFGIKSADSLRDALQPFLRDDA